MFRKSKIYLFIFAALSLSQCSKDPFIPDENGCIELPESTGGFGYIYEQPDIAYNAACFNPSNPNEIVYIRGHYSTNTTELVKYNIATKNESILTTNAWSHPDWGSNGWILFNHADNQIWKIKSNGDSLTQLTFGAGFDAIWNPAGNTFAFWNQITSTYYTFFSDVNGSILDTLYYPNIMYKSAWSPDGNKISTNFNYTLSYINLSIEQTIQVYVPPSTAPVNSMDWLPDSKTIIWCSNDGLFKTNIVTGNTIMIKHGCTSKTYICPSVNSDGSKIIVQRFDLKPKGNNIIWIESNLYIMDVDGKNETKVDFP